MNLRTFLPSIRRSSEAGSGPVTPFGSLQREIDRVFEDFARGWPTLRDFDLSPRMDVTELDNQILVTAELPGLEDKDVKVELADDVLTISGEKRAEKEERNEGRYLVERSYGRFSRSIQLPDGIKPEDIKASMSKGVLTVTLPKPAPTARKTIEVKAGE